MRQQSRNSQRDFTVSMCISAEDATAVDATDMTENAVAAAMVRKADVTAKKAVAAAVVTKIK